LRAGFEYYRAFPEDAKANAGFLKQKLSMPVLGIGGAASFVDHEHLRYVATDVRAVEIKIRDIRSRRNNPMPSRAL
jgi:hypothetical protein